MGYDIKKENAFVIWSLMRDKSLKINKSVFEEDEGEYDKSTWNVTAKLVWSNDKDVNNTTRKGNVGAALSQSASQPDRQTARTHLPMHSTSVQRRIHPRSLTHRDTILNSEL